MYLKTLSEYLENAKDTEELVAQVFHSRYPNTEPEKKNAAWAKGEIKSWRESFAKAFLKVVSGSSIDGSVAVCAELKMPNGGARPDIVVASELNGVVQLVVIEAKQWPNAKRDDECINYEVRATAKGFTDHPLAEAVEYCAKLRNCKFIDNAQRQPGFVLVPVAFVHEMKRPDTPRDLLNPVFQPLLDYPEARIFFKGEEPEFQKFLEETVSGANGLQVVREISESDSYLRPEVGECLNDLLDGNDQAFGGNGPGVEEQTQLVSVLEDLAIKTAKDHVRKVVLIKGGPGTGKSVVGLRLLGRINKVGLQGRFTSQNGSLRAGLLHDLRAEGPLAGVKDFFCNPREFRERAQAKKSIFDCVVADEAPRLTSNSVQAHIKPIHPGDTFITDIIRMSRFSVFLMDENQFITGADLGTVTRIKSEVERVSSQINEKIEVFTITKNRENFELKELRQGASINDIYELEHQFRSTGGQAVIEVVKCILGEVSLSQLSEFVESLSPEKRELLEKYKFQSFNDPLEMFKEIKSLDGGLMKKRSGLVATHCWVWKSGKKGHQNEIDIELPSTQPTLKIRWNKNQTEWITSRNHVEFVGSPHKVLGVDVDTVGVILGPDFIVNESDEVEFRAANRPKGVSDDFKRASGEGGNGPLTAAERARIIRNQYFVLLSRGRDGLFVYSENRKVRERIEKILKFVADCLK